ncbi:uncharacterized protein LOC122505305 [Leptopilina heterotoma]|uniref:uncharacterized protein LOC122505305 n=1 Tax=Leptopilina heterotoma TaxID=63436 RepID=UPI001CA98057|nr:uncharacterized protein LOC122505305 [Leptopilina heterotoma]
MKRKAKTTDGPRKHPNYGTILNESDVTVTLIKEALELIPLLDDVNLRRSFVERWVVECSQHENVLSSILKSMYFTHQKKRCVSILQSIIRFRALFESHIVDGAGISDPDINKRVRWEECESAFACRLYTNVIVNLVHIDISAFLDDGSTLFQDHIRGALNKNGPIVVYGVLIANFKRVENGEEVVKPIPFGTKANNIFSTTLLDDWFEQYIKQPILHSVEEFYSKGSNWNLQSIIRLEINVNKYNPMRASSYIGLPPQIKNKHACINVENKDNQCFKWAVLSALHPNVSHPERVTSYKEFKDELNFDGIEFPVTLKNIPKFEKLNGVSINVYGLSKSYGNFTVHPLHLTAEKRDKHVHLLYVADMYADENNDDNTVLYDNDDFMNFHYVWIKDLSRLVSKQLSKKAHRKHIYDRCLHYFSGVERLNAHIENCKKMNECKIKLPTPDKSLITFKNFKNKEKVPYVIYADCESLLLPADEDVDNLSKTEVFQRHKLLSIGYYIKCSYDESLCKYVPCSKNESDPAKWFAEELKQIAEKMNKVFKNPLPMTALTPQEINDFKQATMSHLS